jgi:hypothetical protein
LVAARRFAFKVASAALLLVLAERMPEQHWQRTPAVGAGPSFMQLDVVLAAADSAVATVSQDSLGGSCLPCPAGPCVCVRMMVVFASLHLRCMLWSLSYHLVAHG